jgi:cysteine desulfurase/selenocysteine lyase
MIKLIWKKDNKWKNLFPIFGEHPYLVYLDNAASTQKPKTVIDWVSDFLKNDYANIHRWLYSLSERSEELYYESKCKLAELIDCKPSEIIYSYNSTYCINLLAQALVNSWKLWKWDKVLLWIREHHSNILPRKVLSKIFGFKIEFINEDKNYNIDRKDFEKKLDKKVKVVSLSQVSNVTGQIMEIEKIREKVWENVFFMVDWSQSVPHFPIEINQIKCDALIMTWHKMMAQTWLWMMYLKRELIKELDPLILWWWTVKDVSIDSFSLQNNADKREAWTPNIIWAVSLLKALEIIESIWWMGKVREHEKTLIEILCEWFKKRKDKIRLIWNYEPHNRIWTFSFVIKNEKNFNKIWEIFSKNNICIRTWWHCAYPLHKSLNIWWSARVSTYLYNTNQDIKKFFECLDSII